MTDHPTQVTEAVERLRLHYDKDSKTVYRAWRGATPKDQPSPTKDMAILFAYLTESGFMNAGTIQLDPLWNKV